jgi:hypothetical protein
MVRKALGQLNSHVIVAGLALLWCGPVAAAAAQPASGANTSAGVNAVLACQAITDPAEQLACFQKASQALAGEKAAGVAKVAAAAPAEAAPPPKPRPFGAPRPPPIRAPKIEKARKAEKVEGVDRLTVKVVAMHDRGDGRWVFKFDDGSTWLESEAESLAGSLRVGQTVTLERGLISGFTMDIHGRSSVRVTRVGDN